MIFPYFSPYFRSPISDMSGPMINAQLGTSCHRMEMRAVNCMEAYGESLGMEKCKDLLDDFFECINKTKQMYRVLEMKVERERQIRRGLRSEPYAEGPAKDSFIQQDTFY